MVHTEWGMIWSIIFKWCEKEKLVFICVWFGLHLVSAAFDAARKRSTKLCADCFTCGGYAQRNRQFASNVNVESYIGLGFKQKPSWVSLKSIVETQLFVFFLCFSICSAILEKWEMED